MKAIDTNIVVRFLTGEDHPQTATARKVIAGGDVFIGTAVVLETDWVLRSVYGLARADVCRALRAFAGLPTVTVENPSLLIKALDHAEKGMDFADAFHLEGSTHCEAFLTFDRKFVRAIERTEVEVLEPR